MARVGGVEHETLLHKTISELTEKGFRVIDLKGKSPDAIAVKDNKILAVEILGKTYKKTKWRQDCTTIRKEDAYKMFDEVIIKTFKRPKPKKKEISHTDIYCPGCGDKMMFESISEHTAMFICEHCEHEIKAILIKNSRVSSSTPTNNNKK